MTTIGFHGNPKIGNTKNVVGCRVWGPSICQEYTYTRVVIFFLYSYYILGVPRLGSIVQSFETRHLSKLGTFQSPQYLEFIG